MFNKKFTAQEMFQYGVVSQVIPEAEWTEKTRAIIKGMSQHNKKVSRESVLLCCVNYP